MATPQIVYYSLAEVKKHNNEKSVWIVIDNEVYDVTPFQNEHPGGADALLSNAGGDATMDFEDVGHSADARELMKSYYIGKLNENDRKPAANSEAKNPGDADAKFPFWKATTVVGLVILGVIAGYLCRKLTRRQL